jgi:hypothetical protein
MLVGKVIFSVSFRESRIATKEESLIRRNRGIGQLKDILFLIIHTGH